MFKLCRSIISDDGIESSAGEGAPKVEDGRAEEV